MYYKKPELSLWHLLRHIGTGGIVKNRKVIALLATLHLVFIFVGCLQTYRAYSGPDKNSRQLAIIVGDNGFIRKLCVTRIDGVGIGSYFKVEIVPGPHTVEVSMFIDAGNILFTAKKTITFEARAGMIYEIKGKDVAPRQAVIWIDEVNERGERRTIMN